MNWKESALLHAKDQDPKESCGLLLNIKGKSKYFACENLSMNDNQCFVMNPEDYVRADNLGQIIAIIHSHPSTPPTPSQADKISCEESNLEWHIVNPKTEKWGYCKPSGYKAPLVGRPYVFGVTDCWSLVRDWYQQEKNIILRDWERPMSHDLFNKDPMFQRCAKETGFRLLAKNEKTEIGDLLFMSIMGKGLNHVALFLGNEVLHHLAGRLSCIEPYSEWLQKCTGERYRYVS